MAANNYGRNARRSKVLLCDQCGTTGGVRRRECPYIVITAAARDADRRELPCCPPPALCRCCFRKAGGTAGVHGEWCRIEAATLQAEEDQEQARFEAGDFHIAAAWGDFRPDVPTGMVRVEFWPVADPNGQPIIRLIPAASYDPGRKGWLSDYPDAEEP